MHRGAMYTSLMADGSLIHRLLSPVANRKERNLRLRVLSPLVNIILKERKKPDASILLRSPLSLLQISKYKKETWYLGPPFSCKGILKEKKTTTKKQHDNWTSLSFCKYFSLRRAGGRKYSQ